MQNYFVRTQNNLYYLESLAIPPIKPAKEVAHHIFVVDRSGSMYRDINPLKQTIEQSIAVESDSNGDVLTTLISFSSHGDLTLHWSKVPATKVMELSGPYIKQIRNIRATYLTGMSQGLHLALEQVDLTQTTGITLFTDGYANDPSASAEVRALDAFVRKASEAPALFLNCVGYRDWCDWPRLNSMSNALSGKTVKARSFKDVLGVMRDTQELLSGSVRSSLVIEAPGMVVAVNRTTGQVNSAPETLTFRGASSDDEIDFYSVRQEPTRTRAEKGYKSLPKDLAYLKGALAIAYTGLSQIRLAKDLLFSSGNKTLWEEHQTAMTPTTLIAMLADLQTWVEAGNNNAFKMGRNTHPKFSLFELADVLSDLPRKSIGLAASRFYKNYKHRTIKKVMGSRGDNNELIPPLASSKRRGDRVYIRYASFNAADASVQLETEAPIDILDLGTQKIVKEVEYIPLDDLTEFRSYTLISCGERNVEDLPIEIYTKEAFEALKPFMKPSQARKFKPGQRVDFALKKFKMEAENCPTTKELLNLVEAQFSSTACSKLYAGLKVPGSAATTPYTTEQIIALKRLHVTSSLYFSPPTTVPYTDRDTAVAKGEIDAYTRYKVHFGTTDVLSAKAFRSGNAFLARRYKVHNAAGEPVKKPKLWGYQEGHTYELKPAGKAKNTPADDVMASVFDSILLDKGTRMTENTVSKNHHVESHVVKDVTTSLRELVMEIGCTGLLPAELESVTTRYEPEAFSAKFDMKLGKAEKEGIFFVADNGLVISIIPETCWYTTSDGLATLAAAK